jgi:predicted Zn finger-like uncharacterized protein
MIEVQCPSCQTRYRIDESVLPAQDSPTFKCSRCGHVFSGDPRLSKKAAPAPRPRPVPPKAAPPAPAASPTPAASPAPAAPQAPSSPRSGGLASPPAEPAPQPAQPPDWPADNAAPQTNPVRPQPAPPSAELRSPPPRAAQPKPGAPAVESYPPDASPITPARATARASAASTRPAAPPADNPLARSFGEEDSREPENLTFDFDDDQSEHHQIGEAAEPAEPEDRYDRWRVGEPDVEPLPAPPTPEIDRYQARRAAIAQASRRIDRAAVSAEASDNERRHSSAFFLGLFALVVIFFVGVTFVFGVSPSISRALLAKVPMLGAEFTPPAPRLSPVSLSQVHAEYRMLDGNRRALIVSGRAENRGAEPLHTIEVGVSLVDNQQHPVMTQSVFCGDLVSPKIVSQMTPHELQFFQKLAPPKNFALKSGDSSPFFVMFINPPPNVINFQVSVIKAEPAGGASMAEAGI